MSGSPSSVTEILLNTNCSARFWAFVKGLGVFRELVNIEPPPACKFGWWPHPPAWSSMDRGRYKTDGEYSLDHTWITQSLLFHVCPLMPSDPSNSGNNKRRHIGNDVVNIIYTDETYRGGWDEELFYTGQVSPHSTIAIPSSSLFHLHINSHSYLQPIPIPFPIPIFIPIPIPTAIPSKNLSSCSFSSPHPISHPHGHGHHSCYDRSPKPKSHTQSVFSSPPRVHSLPVSTPSCACPIPIPILILRTPQVNQVFIFVEALSTGYNHVSVHLSKDGVAQGRGLQFGPLRPVTQTPCPTVKQIVSDCNLPDVVRQLCLHAHVACLEGRVTKGYTVSNWCARFESICNITKRYGQTKLQPSTSNR